MQMVKVYLESRGVPCFAQDELTVQVNQFFSPAVGGVKLQVAEEDFEQAKQLLEEAGYLSEKDDLLKERESKIAKLDKSTSSIPLIGSWRLEYRLLTLVLTFVTLVLLAVYLLFF